MTFARRALLGVTTALAAGGLMLTSASGAPAEAAEEPPAEDLPNAEDVEASKVYKHVWHNAPSYVRPDGSDRAGTLYAGNNYFYCQAEGATTFFHGYTNDWWLLTDDDTGNPKVWVNAVFISGGDNREPIAGVPPCVT